MAGSLKVYASHFIQPSHVGGSGWAFLPSGGEAAAGWVVDDGLRMIAVH